MNLAREKSELLFAALGGFLLGAFVVLVLLSQFRESILPWMLKPSEHIILPGSQSLIQKGLTAPADKAEEQRSAPTKTPDTAVAGESSDKAIVPSGPPSGPVDIQWLRQRNLLLPVQGLDRQALVDSFADQRGPDRFHEAIDITAPRHTPVVAVEDGRIARLWWSDYGGHTIYQFDPTNTYAYYYAHLEKYADDLKERDFVRRGQVLGYVGTSGNAPEDVPHLHFTIFRLDEQKQWWKGQPVNPFEVFR